MLKAPAIWFPTVRTHSGSDVFTERLCAGLNERGIPAEITWLPLRAEYAPWSVVAPAPPAWANMIHVNTWLHPRFVPRHLPVVATMHLCVHDPALEPFKSTLQRYYHRLWIRHVEAGIIQRAEVVTAVSHYTAAHTREIYGYPNIQVIHNGVDTKIFRPLSRTRPNTPFRLLYVGNWSERKGVGLIAPLMEHLGPAFMLHYTADRNGRHLRYDLPGNCCCLGRLDTEELVHAYQTADALLFPSRLEGLPLTVIEAMASGLPVIAADASSLPEVVVDGDVGWLCSADDVPGFAAAARRLAGDKACWQAMHKAARNRAVLVFDVEQQIEQYANLYRTILNQAHAGTGKS